MKVVIQSRRTLQTILTKVKNRPAEEKSKGLVYKVDCNCGSTYIWETNRILDVRLKEHRRVVRSHQDDNGIAVHVAKTHHDILWDSVQVL